MNRSSFRVVLNAVCLAIAVFAALWIVVGRSDGGAGAAFAAPAGARISTGAAPIADAGAAVPDKSEKGEKASAKPSGKEKDKDKDEKKSERVGGSENPDPIDLAIAPDGGVPFHPGAMHFKSPFAKPNGAPPVKVKVGVLVNTIDGYDVKLGRSRPTSSSV